MTITPKVKLFIKIQNCTAVITLNHNSLREQHIFENILKRLKQLHK